MMAFNHSDHTMLGVAVHNFGLPFKSVQYMVAPMYSFGRNTLGGFAELSKTFFPARVVKSLKFGLSVKSFGISDDPKGQFQSYFVAATPYMKLNLAPDRNPKGFAHDLTFKWLYRRDNMVMDQSIETGLKVNHQLQVNRRKFEYKGQLQIEGVVGLQDLIVEFSNYARISTTQEFNLTYLNRKNSRNIHFRLYGGYNLSYNPGSTYYNTMGRYSISMFGSAGYQDVFAENYFFNRATVSGAQYMNDMGGFRTGSDNLRMSNYWATSINATVQLPGIPKMFVAFADFGVYDDGIAVATIYNGGLGINLGDVVGVYFPLVQSTNMGDLYANYMRSIRLTLRFNPFNLPFKISTLLNK
jgi:hypothetical protein